MRIAILQPGYLPWLGFFEQVVTSDVFVHLDTVQYTKQDWRSRNQIKTRDGVQWLTVPVAGSREMKVNEVVVRDQEPWARRHVGMLQANYARAPFFNMYFQDLQEILCRKWTHLVDLDLELIGWLMDKLGIYTKTFRSSQLHLSSDDKQLRIIEICKLLGCNHMYEGQSGQNYMDVGLFEANGIAVEFQEYVHPYYNQQWLKEHGFISHLSVIDLLFNHGPESLAILTHNKVIACIANVKVRRSNDLRHHK